MFNLDRHSAAITARTARQNHVSLNETEEIARLYKNDTYDTFLGDFDTVEEAREEAAKYPPRRYTYQSNGATWLRVEWLVITEVSEDESGIEVEKNIEYIYPAEVEKATDEPANKGNLEDYVDGWDVAQMLHEVIYLASEEDEFQEFPHSFNDLPEFLEFARRDARGARDAEVNIDTCHVNIVEDYITVAFSADGENPRKIEVTAKTRVELADAEVDFDYKFED
jgi:hypothetical protein